MRAWLLPLQQAGKIDVEEEFHQACFHITVYKSYVPTARALSPAMRAKAAPAAAPLPEAPAPRKKPASRTKPSDSSASAGTPA